MREVADNILYIPETPTEIFPFMTGNVYVLVDPKTHHFGFIDSGFTDPFAELVKNEIRSAGLNIQDLDWIVHTHSHSDHWGNDSYFRQIAPNVRIGFHNSAEEFVRDPQVWLRGFEVLTPRDLQYVDSFSQALKSIKPVLIDFHLGEGSDLSIGDINLAVMHVPGHERDCLAFYASSLGILVSGSYLRDARATWTYSVQGGGVSAVKRTFERLAKLKFQVALPNHGEPLLSQAEIEESFKRIHADLDVRTRAILDALQKGPMDFPSLLEKVPAVPKLHPWYMERIVYAHLTDLCESGAVERVGNKWATRPTSSGSPSVGL